MITRVSASSPAQPTAAANNTNDRWAYEQEETNDGDCGNHAAAGTVVVVIIGVSEIEIQWLSRSIVKQINRSIIYTTK